MPGEALLEWYRVDRSREMRRILFRGGLLVLAGFVVVSGSFLSRQPENVRIVAVLLGLALVLSGPLSTFAGLSKPLSEDLYLGLRRDGLVLHFEEPERVVPWEAIERVSFDPGAMGLRVLLREGEAVTVSRGFAGITTDELAKRVDAFRRKAGFHLL